MGSIDTSTFHDRVGHSATANGHVNGHTNGTSIQNGSTLNGTYVTNGGTAPSPAPEPIAICGLALRLPGGIRDGEAFWRTLLEGVDTRSEIPASRFNAAGFSDARGKKGAVATQHGYFLDDDLARLDASFFSMAKQELDKADPQQRLVLEVARECLESAGEVAYRGRLVGCYVGTFGDDWLHSQSRENQYVGGYNLSGDLMIANRVSYEYDFKGPSVVVKTGCSASLVGLHEACRALQAGDCCSALVAGTSLIMGPTTYAAMTQEGILSPEGSCKTFDAAADGFARAEAINAVYIKKLSDAIRDGNPVRAIIRSTGTNSDGKNQGLLQPNGKAHEALMRKVYADAGLNPSDTAFVECHGTGTATGDPIETTAVGNVFGESGVLIGSVKPNVGHSEGASGITSLIKAVLALEHETIPPNIKFSRPNPKIPFEEKKLVVPLKPTPWPQGRAPRISINSFGIGGSNAHVIVESAKGALQARTSADGIASGAPHLLTFSANTQSSLQRMVEEYGKYLQLHSERVADLSYTLTQRREHLTHRAFAIAKDGALGDISAFAKVPGDKAPISMVFSGQGAQWPRMGAELMESSPEFREDLQAMDAVLGTLKLPPTWSICEELSRPAESSRINKAELAQPLCTAVQIALVNALQRSGIQPAAVVGHSSGEIAAAYAAGAISMAEAIIAAYYRGYVSKAPQSNGGMAAVGLGADEVAEFLQGDVVIACENSPSSTTISGDVETLRQVISKIKEARPDVLGRELKVDMAYHSSHMKALAARYVSLIEEELASKKLLGLRHDPQIPFFSSVTAKRLSSAAELGAVYWGANLTSRVRFRSAVHSLLAWNQQVPPTFVEIGPHATLAGPLRQICAEKGAACVHVPTMLRGADCTESLLAAHGQLYQRGVEMDFHAVAPAGKVLSDLPTYAWDHGSGPFWHENRISQAWRTRQYGHHALLGQRIPESTGLTPSWRVVLDLEDEPWLADHRVRDDIVFPFAGYVAMAGEALRQLTGADEGAGYSVRHVVAHTALVLVESKPVELVTTLRRARLTDASDADGWDFIISSYAGGSTWIKNCEGRVQPLPAAFQQASPPGGREEDEGEEEEEELPREVPPGRWYDIMGRVGLVYGPEFRGISALRTATASHAAAGRISSSDARQRAPFPFHPADIDACLQLGLAALAQGAGRNFNHLCVPTLIEELDIGPSAASMAARSWRTPQGTMAIDCTADNGRLALRLRGARLTKLDGEGDGKSVDRHAAARLRWFPDFDFLDVAPLFSPPKASIEVKLLMEELALLCLIDSEERLAPLGEPQQPHFDKFRAWLRREVERAAAGCHPIVHDSAAYVRLGRDARREGIAQRFRTLSKTPSLGLVAQGIVRICENAEGLFTGEVDTLDLLMRDGVLTDIYNAVSFGFSDFVRALALTKPNLRILEVGAGTGGTTELILRDLLKGSQHHPPYACYTFTDISAGFFPQATERFAYAPNMEYRVFDIAADFAAQGFEPQSYDLILAPNVVHATPSLNATLRNLQPLLRPHGHLVLSEVCAVARAPGYVFGNFSGWWLGEADDRKHEPYVQVDRWDRELRAAGFTGVDCAVLDADEPYQYCAAIVSQPKLATAAAAAATNTAVTVLCEQPHEGVSLQLIRDLERAGLDVAVARFGQDSLPEDRDVICSLDLETRFFDGISAPRLAAFQLLLRALDQRRRTVLWLMPPTQVHCAADPRSAQTVGLFRVVRAELALPLATLEIDPAAESAFSARVLDVFRKVCSRADVESIAPDREFAVDAGVVKIGRYAPFSLEDELAAKSGGGGGGSSVKKTLEVGRPGSLDSLRWVEHRRRSAAAIGDDQVEVSPRAVGLNFRDIVVAMGVLSFGDESPPLGIELAGVVRSVGRNVTHVKPGDRVCGVAVAGCFTTDAVLEGPLVAAIPNSLTFEEAATMPGVFTTAVRALIEVGRLEKGQTVLIHSAAGGVGHAAIQICQMIGANVLLTCSGEKSQYLHETFGVPLARIFNSRDDSFLGGVMRETNGRGVDIVLNSLSGELLHASWKCVAEFGMLIELGKRDLAGFGKLDLEPFLMNRSYCCVDLAHMMKERPETVQRVIEKWLDMYRFGQISPIHPMAVFPAAEAEQSFRYLQKGDHIGKAIVTIPEDVSAIPSIPRPEPLTFSADAAFLLTGGLGGLGRSVATWMVERGARELVFLSRSAGKSDEDRTFFAELASMGCDCKAANGKVQDMEAVQRAIAAADRPVKGVIHLAMVLRDKPVLDLTHEDWAETVQPKVDGAWNLHHALLDSADALDFFVMASSLVTLIDQPGQANYAAANTFLESFCQHRHALGLPASVLSICPVDDIGFVAQNPAVRRKLKSQGLFFLPERELLEYVELAILNSRPEAMNTSEPSGSASTNTTTATSSQPWESSGHLIMGLRSETHLDDPSCQTSWRRDRRMGSYHNVPRDEATAAAGSSSSSDSNALKTFIARAAAAGDADTLTSAESAEFLATEIGRRVFRFMMKDEADLRTSLSLAQIGMDSLMAIELRRWWKQTFGLDISVLEIMGSGTLDELGRVAAEGLRKKIFAGAN